MNKGIILLFFLFFIGCVKEETIYFDSENKDWITGYEIALLIPITISLLGLIRPAARYRSRLAEAPRIWITFARGLWIGSCSPSVIPSKAIVLIRNVVGRSVCLSQGPSLN